MSNEAKKWLVRTRGGGFLGPYTESELISEVNAGVFSPDDEIAPSGGYWISAQKLVNREDTEFTRTSTRHTTTKSISVSTTQEITNPNVQAPIQDNLARVPSQSMDPSPYHPPHPQPAPPPRQAQKTQRPVLILLIVALIVVVGILVKIVTTGKKPGPVKPNVALSNDESPFLKQIRALIDAGHRDRALRLLTEKHQSSASRGEIAYLLPYAGLLITENVSAARAQKLLGQVLESPRSTTLQKSEAHRWLGYIQLSQDKGDQGVAHFGEALLFNAKDTAAKFNLGRAYLKQGKPREALVHFKLAEVEAPDLWLIHIYKGHAKVELNNVQEARYNLKRAAEISNERWLGYVYYGLFLNGVVQEREEAQKVMRIMLTKDPFHERNNPPPFGYFFVQENYGDYLAAFSQIMSGGNSRLLNLGKLYIKYLANGPKSREGKRILTLAQKGGGIMTRVIALKILLDNNAPVSQLSAAIQKLPPTLDDFGYYAYLLRGTALLNVGKFEAAGKDLKRALFLGPKTAISRLSYADWLQRAGKDQDAKEELMRILTYHPNYIPAIKSLQKFQ